MLASIGHGHHPRPRKDEEQTWESVRCVRYALCANRFWIFRRSAALGRFLQSSSGFIRSAYETVWSRLEYLGVGDTESPCEVVGVVIVSQGGRWIVIMLMQASLTSACLWRATCETGLENSRLRLVGKWFGSPRN